MDRETLDQIKHFLAQMFMISILVLGGYFLTWAVVELVKK